MNAFNLTIASFLIFGLSGLITTWALLALLLNENEERFPALLEKTKICFFSLVPIFVLHEISGYLIQKGPDKLIAAITGIVFFLLGLFTLFKSLGGAHPKKNFSGRELLLAGLGCFFVFIAFMSSAYLVLGSVMKK